MTATKRTPISDAFPEGGPDETIEPTAQDLRTIAEISAELDARKPLSHMESLRRIVKVRSMGKVDGIMVDLFTASIAVQVYDQVTPELRAKLDALPIKRMLGVCLKACER